MLTLWKAAKRMLPNPLQRFLSWPGTDRVHTWASDVNMVGVGLALAALAWGYKPDENPSPWDTGLFCLFLVTAGLFLVTGILAKTPTAVVDERWDDRYDELRDQTEAVLPVLSSTFIGSVWSRALNTEHPARENWQEYTQFLPLPIPDERPLHEWRHFLQNHESIDVRRFFQFAQAAGSIIQVSNYRRYAVRTYHRYGRLIKAGADGFEGWFEDEGVKDGAEALVVLLAYLEIARAVQQPTEFRGDGHSGFWYLAERWHPLVMRLPRPTPTEPAPLVEA